ncbi:hypothetical protein J4Q44_G00091130, partial [Coregonus suidteri]
QVHQINTCLDCPIHTYIYIHSAFGKYSDPLTFSTFCCYSLILKWIKLFFSPQQIDTQYPILTKRKQVFRNFCEFIQNIKLKYLSMRLEI